LGVSVPSNTSVLINVEETPEITLEDLEELLVEKPMRELTVEKGYNVLFTFRNRRAAENVALDILLNHKELISSHSEPLDYRSVVKDGVLIPPQRAATWQPPETLSPLSDDDFEPPVPFDQPLETVTTEITLPVAVTTPVVAASASPVTVTTSTLPVTTISTPLVASSTLTTSSVTVTTPVVAVTTSPVPIPSLSTSSVTVLTDVPSSVDSAAKKRLRSGSSVVPEHLQKKSQHAQMQGIGLPPKQKKNSNKK
jgi:hypothetical protein